MVGSLTIGGLHQLGSELGDLCRLALVNGLGSARTGASVLGSARLAISLLLELAPAAGPVVGVDLPEHRGQRGAVEGLGLADGHGAGGLVAVPAGDDPLRVGHDAAV